MKYYLFLILFFSGLIFNACKKDQVETRVDHSLKYMPLDTGYNWTYQMDSIYYPGNGGQADTFNYMLQYEVVSTHSDAEDRQVYVIELKYKADSFSPWKYVRTLSLTTTDKQIIRNDFNHPELILSFPVGNEKIWNGLQYTGNGEADYYYLNCHESGTFGVHHYDSTLTVIHEEEINLITSYKGRENYAAGTGMVYKSYERLDNISSPNYISGYCYTLSLINFEK